MSPEAQRIAIAEACGWKYQKGTEPTYGGINIPTGWWRPNGKFVYQCPDYLSDLNAMNDALNTLKSDRAWTAFLKELENACHCAEQPKTTWLFLLVNATAAQRAEAFLRTLGKWDDSK